MDLSSQKQYIQRATNAAVHFDNTNRTTVYTVAAADTYICFQRQQTKHKVLSKTRFRNARSSQTNANNEIKYNNF